jgi:hypothetical protein
MFVGFVIVLIAVNDTPRAGVVLELCINAVYFGKRWKLLSPPAVGEPITPVPLPSES